MSNKSVKDMYDLTERVAIITGGAGFLGVKHAEAIAEFGGMPVLLDINGDAARTEAKKISDRFGVPSIGIKADITEIEDIRTALDSILKEYARVDILINNAANDPKVKQKEDEVPWSRFENFSLETWNSDIAVGLTGAFQCCQVFGAEMAKKHVLERSEGKSGVILNIASDLGVIAPDQRIYRKDGLPDNLQNVKPVSYSVIKHGIIGLTKYLATYWAKNGIRVNSISPGGVYNNQPSDFVEKLTNLIPMGRMADRDEYKAAIVFLVSDASSYMTGANLIIDGGRTCW